ncbi:hypothetical protein Bpfe_009672 [Biomphalaria pfeifferi]|uniref:Uncharacterized protein n=1 Tax=Biomphalaria pfeifferi TaxID=112525 RepID=A0AAD8BV83_BIOPF|nr:hypothetical protein Bpfe_009672 [Biomphalaria pfeifferi]
MNQKERLQGIFISLTRDLDLSKCFIISKIIIAKSYEAIDSESVPDLLRSSKHHQCQVLRDHPKQLQGLNL